MGEAPFGYAKRYATEATPCGEIIFGNIEVRVRHILVK